MSNKIGSSDASWAILTNSVTSAKVEAHQLGIFFERILKLVEKSNQRDHIHQVAGDMIKSAPETLDRLNTQLDKASYSLALIGSDFFGPKLPLDDKVEVITSVAVTKPLSDPTQQPEGLKKKALVTKYLLK